MLTLNKKLQSVACSFVSQIVVKLNYMKISFRFILLSEIYTKKTIYFDGPL